MQQHVSDLVGIPCSHRHHYVFPAGKLFYVPDDVLKVFYVIDRLVRMLCLYGVHQLV